MTIRFEELEKNTSAIQWCLCTRTYLEIADLVNKRVSDKTLKLRFDSPLLMLLGHGFELTLKANLRASGLSLDEISKYGHSLNKLLRAKGNQQLRDSFDQQKAAGYKLRPSITSPDLTSSFALLAVLHGPPYVLRYPIVHTRPALDTKILIEVGLKLNREIEPACLKSFNDV